MSSTHVRDLDSVYEQLEKRWLVENRGDFATLVVPNGNGGAPVHRWFRMKEAFSCELLGHVASLLGLDQQGEIAVLDPFAGSGTVAVSLAEQVERGKWSRARFLGLESNPYLHLVASAKVRAVGEGAEGFDELSQRVAAKVAGKRVSGSELPGLSTFANPEYFPSGHVEELLAIRAAIAHEEGNGSNALALDLAKLCLGAAVEPASKLRRDGRALRFEPEKSAVRPLDAFLARAATVVDDLPTQPVDFQGQVLHHDAREPWKGIKRSPAFDLALFSPPYPNNIDYTEVYKLEAWLLGYYESSDDFAEQRGRTIRSHASLKFPVEPDELTSDVRGEVDALVQPILDAVPAASRYVHARRRTIKGYAYDMMKTLLEVKPRMQPGGKVVYVVGNSLHGNGRKDAVLIAADLLVARLAELAGMRTDRIFVARTPSRRRTTSSFLRESVVFVSV